MRQDKIWDHLQNEGRGDGVFPEARQKFILRRLRPGQVVLNVGVGAGTLERLAAARGIDIYALDPNERAIARLRDELNLGERAQAGYAQKLPFHDRKFDVVVMSEVLEHLDDESLTGALREVLRVLKPGGFLLATTPYREKLDEGGTVCPDCGCVFHRFGHVQSFDRDRMATILKAHGFQVARLQVTTFVDWSRPGLRSLIKTLSRIFLARMGESIADPHLVVHARRTTAEVAT